MCRRSEGRRRLARTGQGAARRPTPGRAGSGPGGDRRACGTEAARSSMRSRRSLDATRRWWRCRAGIGSRPQPAASRRRARLCPQRLPCGLRLRWGSQPVASPDRSFSSGGSPVSESSCVRGARPRRFPEAGRRSRDHPGFAVGTRVRVRPVPPDGGKDVPVASTGTLNATAPACSSQNPSSPAGCPHGQTPGTSGVVIGISVCVLIRADQREPLDDASSDLVTVPSCGSRVCLLPDHEVPTRRWVKAAVLLLFLRSGRARAGAVLVARLGWRWTPPLPPDRASC